MAEGKKENWTTFVALSTAVMAVLAAITTLYMGKFSSRVILAQAQESDQWSFYQAKSIKGHTFEVQRQFIELEYSANRARMSADVSDKYLKAMAGYDKNLKRYDDEKKEIKSKAEALAKEKENSQERAGRFGYGVIFLQIAIMVSSTAVITKKKPLWFLGLASGLLGAFYFINGFYLFF